MKNAVVWRYAPENVGAIGFSAGGRIVVELAIVSNKETRPKYIASSYGALFSGQIGDGSLHQLASLSSQVPVRCKNPALCQVPELKAVCSHRG
jgi:dienelactone hydrolase